jgi:glycosyltransferase involved in cell wall biosynthesis
MTNILVVHPSDELYGVDVVLLALIDSLADKEFRFYVLLPRDVSYEGRLAAELIKRGVTYWHYDLAVLRRKYFTPIGILKYVVKFVASIFYLRSLIRENLIDIVYSNTLAVLPGAFAANFTARSHVWHVHEIIERPRFLWRLTSWLSAHMTKTVVGVSKAVQKHLQTGCESLDKVQVIHNGIDFMGFTSKVCLEKSHFSWNDGDALVIGVVGRISPIKGQDYFLDVAADVVKSCPRARFAIVGSPVPGRENLLNALKEKSIRLGIESCVFFEGFQDEVWNVLESLDVVVLPSVQADSFPTIILEAMALAKPVVAFAVGGVPEMIEDGVTGFLVPPGAHGEMVERLGRLLQDERLRLAMGTAGRCRVEKLFSRSQFAQQWQGVFESV